MPANQFPVQRHSRSVVHVATVCCADSLGGRGVRAQRPGADPIHPQHRGRPLRGGQGVHHQRHRCLRPPADCDGREGHAELYAGGAVGRSGRPAQEQRRHRGHPEQTARREFDHPGGVQGDGDCYGKCRERDHQGHQEGPRAEWGRQEVAASPLPKRQAEPLSWPPNFNKNENPGSG